MKILSKWQHLCFSEWTQLYYEWCSHFNSLAPSRFWLNFRWVIFKQILVIDGWGISYEIALRWMPLDLTDDKSTLVQVMAWCRQATSHYLNQCWPRSLWPYGVTRPQWVNIPGCGFSHHSFVVTHWFPVCELISWGSVNVIDRYWYVDTRLKANQISCMHSKFLKFVFVHLACPAVYLLKYYPLILK